MAEAEYLSSGNPFARLRVWGCTYTIMWRSGSGSVAHPIAAVGDAYQPTSGTSGHPSERVRRAAGADILRSHYPARLPRPGYVQRMYLPADSPTQLGSWRGWLVPYSRICMYPPQSMFQSSLNSSHSCWPSLTGAWLCLLLRWSPSCIQLLKLLSSSNTRS